MNTTLIARVDYLPMHTHCDSTGKLKSEAEQKKDANSNFAGRIELQVWNGSTPLISFKVGVIRGRTENFIAWPKDNYTGKPIFELSKEIEDEFTKMALRLVRPDTTIREITVEL